MHCVVNLPRLLLVCLVLWTTACQKEVYPIVKPSDFTKAQREELGDAIQNAIASDRDNFTILPNIPPYDTSAYWYIQNLYNQVTNSIRIDNQSPDNNRWDLARPWRITILDEGSLNAFAVPGGHLYITTGLLKSLRSEHELYYLLAYEAAMVDSKILLNRLMSEHNGSKLVDILEGRRVADGTNARSLALIIGDLDFSEEEVLLTDESTAELICETSIFERRGLLPILDRLSADEGFQWLQNRFFDVPSRRDFIQNAIDLENCGTFTQNGGYQNHVLSVLQ